MSDNRNNPRRLVHVLDGWIFVLKWENQNREINCYELLLFWTLKTEKNIIHYLIFFDVHINGKYELVKCVEISFSVLRCFCCCDPITTRKEVMSPLATELAFKRCRHHLMTVYKNLSRIPYWLLPASFRSGGRSYCCQTHTLQWNQLRVWAWKAKPSPHLNVMLKGSFLIKLIARTDSALNQPITELL